MIICKKNFQFPKKKNEKLEKGRNKMVLANVFYKLKKKIKMEN